MPIEIKELHIRVTVNAGAGKAGGEAPKDTSAAGRADANQGAIVAECVEQVLEVVQSKKER